jgi:Xaa-Pro aminopeptidase
VFHINDRIEKIRDHLQRQKIDAFLVCNPENIRYLSGFTGGYDARLFITAQRKYISVIPATANRLHANVLNGN